MKTINHNTKRAAALIVSYHNSDKTSLSDCYGRYSFAKGRAEALCRRQMEKENGIGFKIISYNTFGFSCAWVTEKGLRIETPQYSYLVPAE